MIRSMDSLNDFDPEIRRDALLADLSDREFPAPDPLLLNAHVHTFFSFNYLGYSPTCLALEAKIRGLEMAGIVDFDVLDGLDEFWQTSRLLDLKACIGLESRVFVPEFSERVINSPGEPGISYHMGTGFTSTDIPKDARDFLDSLVLTSEKRNRAMIDRVNSYLEPLVLNYDQDVLPLTPKGNATERHLCMAYARKAASKFLEESELRSFWSHKLGVDSINLKDLPDGRGMTDLIRAKTMKKGGVGYVQPDSGSFPKMSEMNEFILKCGALPTFTWLDGTSEGERSIEELIEIGRSTGVVVFNVIPDRNYTPGCKDEKLKNLQKVVGLTKELDLPLLGGTEMNSPGQKFVDDFQSEELEPLHALFLRGSHILHAHSTLQKLIGMGYLSDWAEQQFASVSDKNLFFAEFGKLFSPRADARLQEVLSLKQSAAEVLDHARNAMIHSS